MLSIIIPSYKDPLLHKTIDDLLAKASGNIEIIAVLDGYWPKEPVVTDDRVKVLHLGSNRGMRGAINAGVIISSGEYIMKCDAHCSFDEGFDVKLINDHQKDWIQVPTRKRLDADSWGIINDGRPDINYLYLNDEYRGRIWNEKNKDPDLKNVLIDDIVAFQGSCYFMSREYYDRLNILDDKSFGGMGHESQEIVFKCWVKGGRVVRNKKTWYAHCHRSNGLAYDRSKSRECMKRWIPKRIDTINKYNSAYGKN